VAEDFQNQSGSSVFNWGEEDIWAFENLELSAEHEEGKPSPSADLSTAK